MKYTIKILLIFWLIFTLFWYPLSDAKVDFDGIKDTIKPIQDASIGEAGFTATSSLGADSSSIVGSINRIGISLLKTAKVIFGWVLVIFIVYTWIQMMISLGSNEEELKKAKTSLWYAVVWLVFINIPGTIFNAFNRTQPSTLDGRIWYNSRIRTPGDSDTNVFIDVFNFWYTLNTDIVGFIEVALAGIAIFMIIISGLKIITSRWKDEELTKQKNKIGWSIIWLIFVWFIESWKYLVFEWRIQDGVNFFDTLANLALFFAGPIAIFFLTLAGYYYITSNGDEERVKKGKNIVINTLIATIIILASYTFLKDLQGISIPTL